MAAHAGATITLRQRTRVALRRCARQISSDATAMLKAADQSQGAGWSTWHRLEELGRVVLGRKFGALAIEIRQVAQIMEEAHAHEARFMSKAERDDFLATSAQILQTKHMIESTQAQAWENDQARRAAASRSSPRDSAGSSSPPP